MKHLLYLFSIILFCGPCLLILWKRDGRVLKRYELVLLIMVAISLPVAISDYFAIRWQAWSYNPATTLNIRFPGELESYLFSAAVTVLIASATLILARQVDLRHKSKTKSRRAYTGRKAARRGSRPGRPILKPVLRSKF